LNLLLDTHVLLWWLGEPSSLSVPARAAIADPGNTVFLSAVVVWEIRIKSAIGKLGLPEHAHEVATLPKVHRDPFDRMLVAQAACERFTLVTRDASISAYPVPTLLA